MNGVFRAYGSKCGYLLCFRFSGKGVFISERDFVSYPVGFFLTFVSKRIHLVLGSLGVLGQECTLMNICEICSQLNIFLT